MKSESDKLRDLMNIMEGKKSHSTTLNEGPKWERFKTDAKAAFGNKRAQGSQKRQALAKKFEDAWETWLGQTGSTGTKEDLEHFLSTKAGFAPEDTDAIMGNESDNLLGSGGGRTEPRLGENPPQNPPSDGSENRAPDNSPSAGNPQPSPNGGSATNSSSSPSNSTPNEDRITQAISDYQKKFKDFYQNSNGGKGLDTASLEEIADSAKRISTLYNSNKDKLPSEKVQDLEDLYDQANTMLVNGGYIEGDAHGFSSNDLTSSQRGIPESPPPASNNSGSKSQSSTKANTRPTFAPVNDNPTSNQRGRPPANDNPRESRIFEAGDPMNKQKVQQIFDKAAAYAFKKGLVGNPEYNNQGYRQQDSNSYSSNRNSSNRSDLTRMKKDLKTDINSDVLRTAINTAHISTDQLEDLRDEATSHDIKNIKSPEITRGLAAVGWAFFRNLGK